LLEILGGDVLGDVERVDVDFSIPHFVVKPGNIRLDADLGGGSFMDVGCYAVDLMRAAWGEPTVVSADAVLSAGDPRVDLQTEVEGGGLMDVGCYTVSGSRFLAGGEPERVFGEAWYGPTGTDWVFAGTMRFPGNVIAAFDCGTALVNRDELEAIGSEGSLFVDDPWHCLKPGIELRRDNGVERIEIEQQDSYRLELENMSDAIRGEAELLLARDDAMAQARALEALHESATTSAPVTL
jgi:predicted dehydrogenase